MWREGTVSEKVRQSISMATAPVWVAATAVGQEVGSAEPPATGIFFVFTTMCAFYSEGNPIIPRWAISAIDEIASESGCVRIASAGRLFKLSHLDEYSAVVSALNFLHTHHQAEVEELSDVERSALVYPEQTRRTQFLGSPIAGEYVVQHVDGAILTTHRLFFSTSVVRLAAVLMMHPTPDGLKVIVNKTLTIMLRCSSFRQGVIVRLWLASLSIRTHHYDPLGSFPGDMAMKCHVVILERLHKQFCAIDSSADGLIAEGELAAALGPLFSCPSFSASFFSALDLDNDQTITFVEFASGMTCLLANTVMDRILFSFRMFDSDKDGNLSESELFDALRALSSTGDVMVGEDVLHEVCDSLFTIMDEDGSGTISVAEYKEALANNIQVHELFRRIGITTENNERDDIHEFSDRLITFGDPLWILTASLMQSLLVGVNTFKPRVPKGEVTPLTPSAEEFAEVTVAPINIAVSILESRGDKAPTAAPADPQLAMYAPAVFQTLRQSFGVSFRDFELSLGLDNLVGNMMLGSHNTLRRAQFQSEKQFTFVSSNELLLVHSLTRAQLTHLLGTLPQYVTFIRNNPNSLLPRFLSVFTMRAGLHELHFAVCLNPLRTSRTLEGVFSVKGIPGRLGSGGQLHEGNLTAVVELVPGWATPVRQQLSRDCAYLSSIGCADFSLVIGLSKLALPRPPTSTSSQSEAFKKAMMATEPQKKQKSGGLLSCCKASSVKQQQVVAPAAAVEVPVQSVATVETGTITLESSTVFSQNSERGLQLPPIGIFHELDGGLRSLRNGIVYFGLTDVLNKADDRAQITQFEASFLDYCSKWIAGEDEEDCQSVEIDPQAVTAPIVTENGKKATIAMDGKRKQLFVVSASGKCLLSINVVLASGGTSFVRNISLADKYKNKLSIRSGMVKMKGTASYEVDRTVTFQNIVERERFMSEVYKASCGSSVDGLKIGSAKVCVITWNVGDAVPAPIDVLMAHARGCDLVCVAVQECNYHAKGQPAQVSCEADWFTRVHQQLPEFEKVCAVSLWSIRVIVLVHSTCVHRVSNICHSTEATGVGSVMGNKGGIAVGLKFDESSMCFIGAHLAAHLERVSDRNADFTEIVEGVSARMGFQGIDVLNAYHHVFWCGDLNYRIDAMFSDVVQFSTTNQFSKLYPYDQLMAEMDAGRVFLGFTEPAPNFSPTYRFLRDTDKSHPRMYDEWKSRIPSWCDRILHKSLGHPVDSVKRLQYDAEHSVRSSDHSPVFALFEVSIRQQYCFSSADQTICAALRITGLSCRDLMQADTFGLSDPWMRMLCPFFSAPQRETRTRTIFKTLDPEWREPYEFALAPVTLLMLSTEYITFVIYDEDYNGTNDPLGQAVCSLHILSTNPLEPHRVELPVMRFGQQRGTLYATIQVAPLQKR